MRFAPLTFLELSLSEVGKNEQVFCLADVELTCEQKCQFVSKDRCKKIDFLKVYLRGLRDLLVCVVGSISRLVDTTDRIVCIRLSYHNDGNLDDSPCCLANTASSTQFWQGSNYSFPQST